MLLVLLLQSTALLSLGLLALRLTRWRGPAVQTLVGRASLASVALLVLLLPLTGHIPPVVRVEPTPQQAATLPEREGEEVQTAKRTAGTLLAAPSAVPAAPSPQEGQTRKEGQTRGSAPTPRPPSPGGQALALGGFLSVSAFLLLWLGVCQRHLTRLRRASQSITTGPAATLLAELTSTPPRLLMHSSVYGPFLAGYRRPVIFLPATYAADFDTHALRAIFIHELAHRDRRDNLWTLAARLLTALLWPQPLLWLLVRRLEHISEDACDEAVLAQHCPPRAYADCLLSLASRPPLRHSQRTLNAGVAPFRSSVGRRISRILTTQGDRPMSPITLRLRLTAATLTVAAAFSGALLVSSAPAQTTAPAPFVPIPQELQRQAERKTAEGRLVSFGIYDNGKLIKTQQMTGGAASAASTSHDQTVAETHTVVGYGLIAWMSRKEFQCRAVKNSPASCLGVLTDENYQVLAVNGRPVPHSAVQFAEICHAAPPLRLLLNAPSQPTHTVTFQTKAAYTTPTDAANAASRVRYVQSAQEEYAASKTALAQTNRQLIDEINAAFPQADAQTQTKALNMEKRIGWNEDRVEFSREGIAWYKKKHNMKNANQEIAWVANVRSGLNADLTEEAKLFPQTVETSQKLSHIHTLAEQVQELSVKAMEKQVESQVVTSMMQERSPDTSL